MREGSEDMIERKLLLGRLLSFYGALLSETQRELASLYLEEDLSMGEIAERQNVTRQGVYDLLNRVFTRLEEYESALGLCRRFDKTTDKLIHLKEMLERIRPETDQKELCMECIRIADELICSEEQE